MWPKHNERERKGQDVTLEKEAGAGSHRDAQTGVRNSVYSQSDLKPLKSVG